MDKYAEEIAHIKEASLLPFTVTSGMIAAAVKDGRAVMAVALAIQAKGIHVIMLSGDGGVIIGTGGAYAKVSTSATNFIDEFHQGRVGSPFTFTLDTNVDTTYVPRTAEENAKIKFDLIGLTMAEKLDYFFRPKNPSIEFPHPDGIPYDTRSVVVEVPDVVPAVVVN